jgi:hypothetical protein
MLTCCKSNDYLELIPAFEPFKHNTKVFRQKKIPVKKPGILIAVYFLVKAFSLK